MVHQSMSARQLTRLLILSSAVKVYTVLLWDACGVKSKAHCLNFQRSAWLTDRQRKTTSLAMNWRCAAMLVGRLLPKTELSPTTEQAEKTRLCIHNRVDVILHTLAVRYCVL